jgi:NAD(P)-dependent dehydrogenase (short-subunit alcohol dehydrogenase family)
MAGPRGIALVTGATSGIGLASAAILAADGWEVVATARDPDRAGALEELAATHDGLDVRQLDVTVPESVTACVEGVLADHGAIDLLLNNAGVGHRGTLEQLSDEALAASLDVNFWGVARMTRAVLPGMRERRCGRIVTITSTNGIVGMPFSDAYNAAKFAVEGLMEGLAAVMRHFGVAVVVVEPGPVRTAFLRNAHGQTGDVRADDPYAAELGRLNATMAGMLDAGEAPEVIGGLVAKIAREPTPHFRYQSSDTASMVAAGKWVDPTGDTLIDFTSALLSTPPE